MVFCHGLTGDLSQPAELAGGIPGVRVVVWDARAHGRTEPMAKGSQLHFAGFARDLAALLGHLEIDRAIVGGISMGAGVSLAFAAAYPGRVEALVLVRPAWLLQPNPPNLRLLVEAGRLLRSHSPAAAERRMAERADFRRLRARSEPAAESILQQFHKPKAARRHQRLLRIPGSAPLAARASVSRISAPALVVGTRRDLLHPVGMARQWARWLPHAELREIPSKFDDATAHTTAFRRVLARFLARLEAGR